MNRLSVTWVSQQVSQQVAQALLPALFFLHLIPSFAQDPRQIIEEAQRRGRVTSQRYEGVLEVFSAANKVSKKSWTTDRLGSFGNSKAIIRFTAPAEVKGVALLVVNHPDRAYDQWMDPRHRPRPPHCPARSRYPFLRHRLQFRGSRRARCQPIRLPPHR